MLVNYNAKNLFYYKNFRFVPQANIVPDDLWAEMKKNPVIKVKIKNGMFVEQGQIETESGETADVTHSLECLGLKEAKELVKKCLDIVQLDKWFSNETRKGVLSAIETQITELTKHQKEQNGSNPQ